MTWTKRDSFVCIFLACIAGFLFIPFLGTVHLFDGEELKNAEIAREMILTGDYFRTHLDFQASWQKPPFFFWLQVISMKVFGVNEFAARFPNALLGMIVLPLLYALGKNVSGRGNFGILWALCYGGSIFPALNFTFGFPDPWFNAWILLSIYALSGYYAPQGGKIHSMRRVAFAGVAAGMALLTNGVFAVLLVLLPWLLFWLVRRRDELFPLTELAVCCALALAVSLLWYGVELWRSGLWFFREFAHLRLRSMETVSVSIGFLYRPFYLLLGCFPASGLIASAPKVLLQSWSLLKARDTFATFTVWVFLLLPIALLAGLALQTNMMLFASLAYFPITFFAARVLDSVLRGGSSFSRVSVIFFLGLATLLVFFVVLLPLTGIKTSWLLEQTQDTFQRSNAQAAVILGVWEFLIVGGFIVVFLGSVYFLYKRRYFEMVFTIFPATLVATLCFSLVVMLKIEGSTQAAAIEFYQGLQGQQCYIQTLGFTTYADLFYAQKQSSQSASALNIPPEDFEQWLLEEDIDHTAYFVCKSSDAALWRKHPYLTELYEKNGFVFFQREVKKKLNLAGRFFLGKIVY